VFDITFLNGPPERQEEGWDALRGRIVLGEFEEEFLAALGPWGRSAYERHWIEAASRVVDLGHDRTGFFTSAFQFFWIMWRRGDDLLVHEKLLIQQTLLEPFDPADPYRQIGEYARVNDDGVPVSEWRVSMDDLRAFLVRSRERGRRG
jgi:hypothetical protein